MGAFENTNSEALGVIANVMPFRLCRIEICNREWVKIMSLPDSHPLKQSLVSENKFYEGRQ